MTSFLLENPPWRFEPRLAPEGVFEAQVLRIATQVMPGFMTAQWKPLIRDTHGRGAQPDLAMLSNDLESWYVIEVELASHSISGHIAPQLETLRNGVYDTSLLPSLRSAFPSIGDEALTRLLYRSPGLLCIADQYTDRLERACRHAGFRLIVLEPYFGGSGGWAVLVHRLPAELVSASSHQGYIPYVAAANWAIMS